MDFDVGEITTLNIIVENNLKLPINYFQITIIWHGTIEKRQKYARQTFIPVLAFYDDLILKESL